MAQMPVMMQKLPSTLVMSKVRQQTLDCLWYISWILVTVVDHILMLQQSLLLSWHVAPVWSDQTRLSLMCACRTQLPILILLTEAQIYICGISKHTLGCQSWGKWAHYEWMLSKSHPMYLQNLSFDLLHVCAKGDFTMFVLILVTVIVVPPSVIIGMYNLWLFILPAKVNEQL